VSAIGACSWRLIASREALAASACRVMVLLRATVSLRATVRLRATTLHVKRSALVLNSALACASPMY